MTLKSRFAAALAVLMMLAGSAQAAEYAYGADVGWVTQQEAEGHSFNDSAGVKTDPFVLLKSYGINAIRLRVWVDPAGGWNGKADLLAKAKRAQAQGQAIMIDFHYSDNWADPGKQNPPAAWAGHDAAQLTRDVYEHTVEVLGYLKENGIDVAWVQPGNEITNGMLWPLGKTDQFGNLVAFTNAGYDATKAVYPQAQVVIHIDNGWDTAKAQWWFDHFATEDGKADIIGLSYYPEYTPSKDWKKGGPLLSATLVMLAQRYHKPVMIVETGYRYDKPAEAKAMLSDVIARNKALGELGQGVFYWEPDTVLAWTGYKLGAMNAQNQFTEAMEAFRH